MTVIDAQDRFRIMPSRGNISVIYRKGLNGRTLFTLRDAGWPSQIYEQVMRQYPCVKAAHSIFYDDKSCCAIKIYLSFDEIRGRGWKPPPEKAEVIVDGSCISVEFTHEKFAKEYL